LALGHCASIGRRVYIRHTLRYNIEDVIRYAVYSLTLHLTVDCGESLFLVFASVTSICDGSEDDEDTSGNCTYDDGCQEYRAVAWEKNTTRRKEREEKRKLMIRYQNGSRSMRQLKKGRGRFSMTAHEHRRAKGSESADCRFIPVET
jgi:hypothetical protein